MEIGALVVAAPFLLYPSALTPWAIAVIVASWLVRWRATGRLSAATALDGALALLVVMAGVGFAVSALPDASAQEASGVVLGVAVYYALVQQRVTPRQALAWVTAIGLVFSLLAVVRADWSVAAIGPVGPLDAAYTVLERVVQAGLRRTAYLGTLLNPRQVGGVASLALPPAVVLLWLQRGAGWWRQLVAAAVALALLAVLVLSQSVSGVAGVLIALWLAIVVADEKRRAGWLLATAAGLVVIVAGAAVRLGLPGRALELVAAESKPRPGLPHAAFGIESRLEIWQRALQMIHDMPYSGIGSGSFRLLMARFYPGFILGPEPHAHDMWLQAGVDFGLPGLAAYVWLLLGAAVILIWGWRRQADRGQRVALLGLGAGVLAYAIFGTIDVVSLGSKPGLLLWIALGLSVAAVSPSLPRPGRRALHGSLLAALLVTLVAPLSWDGLWLNAGHTLAQKALLLTNNPRAASELQESAGLLQTATTQDPGDSASLLLLAHVQAAAGDYPAALAATRQAVQADSVRPLSHYSPLRAAVGASPDEVRTVYSNWVTRSPGDAVWYAADAIAANQAGDLAAARATVAEGLRNHAQPEGLLQALEASFGAPA